MLNFNFKMNAPPGSMTFTAADDMIILKLEGTSISGNPMYLSLLARYVGVGNWQPVFKSDNNEVILNTVNLMAANWYIAAALGSSNADAQQVGRLINNIASSIQKRFIPLAESWDFTYPVKLKYFSDAIVAPFYFHGSVGRIDYVGGAFDTSANTANSDNVLEWKLPCIIVLTQTSSCGWTLPTQK
jgi:hypothetical protein